MLFNDFCRFFSCHFNISDSLFACLKNFHNGLILADTDASCLSDGNFFIKTRVADALSERVKYGACARRDSAGCKTDDNADIV